MPNEKPRGMSRSSASGCILQPSPLTVQGSWGGARSLGQKDTFFTRDQLRPRDRNNILFSPFPHTLEAAPGLR